MAQGHEAIALQAALERVNKNCGSKHQFITEKDVTWLEKKHHYRWWDRSFGGVVFLNLVFFLNLSLSEGQTDKNSDG